MVGALSAADMRRRPSICTAASFSLRPGRRRRYRVATRFGNANRVNSMGNANRFNNVNVNNLNRVNSVNNVNRVNTVNNANVNRMGVGWNNPYMGALTRGGFTATGTATIPGGFGWRPYGYGFGYPRLRRVRRAGVRARLRPFRRRARLRPRHGPGLGLSSWLYGPMLYNWEATPTITTPITAMAGTATAASATRSSPSSRSSMTIRSRSTHRAHHPSKPLRIRP